MPGEEESFAGHFLHVCMQPHDPLGAVTTKFETFMPVSHVAQHGGFSRGQSIKLGMIPAGSGASPNAIFNYCVGKSTTECSSRGFIARVSLRCLLSRTLASVIADCNNTTREVSAATFRKDEEAQTVPSNDQLDEFAGGTLSCSSLTRDISSVKASNDTTKMLQEELYRVQNELRMQQAVANFQQRRLESFESQSEILSPLAASSISDREMIVHMQELGQTVEKQQSEIKYLRDELDQRRQCDEHALQQLERLMRIEINLRDQRIVELEETLQGTEQQLDGVPDVIDSMLRTPPRSPGGNPLCDHESTTSTEAGHGSLRSMTTFLTTSASAEQVTGVSHIAEAMKHRGAHHPMLKAGTPLPRSDEYLLPRQRSDPNDPQLSEVNTLELVCLGDSIRPPLDACSHHHPCTIN